MLKSLWAVEGLLVRVLSAYGTSDPITHIYLQHQLCICSRHAAYPARCSALQSQMCHGSTAHTHLMKMGTESSRIGLWWSLNGEESGWMKSHVSKGVHTCSSVLWIRFVLVSLAFTLLLLTPKIKIQKKKTVELTLHPNQSCVQLKNSARNSSVAHKQRSAGRRWWFWCLCRTVRGNGAPEEKKQGCIRNSIFPY